MPLAREHVRRLGLRRNDDVLEFDCGSGALTAALADRLGGQHVHAVEPSETEAEACRNRVPGADVRVGTEGALPTFGVELAVATSHLVLNLLSDADAAVRAMCARVRRGGTVASVVWDYKAGMSMLRAFWDAALQLDPSAPDEGRTMPHCTPAALRALWGRCELDDIRTEELVVDAFYESFDDLWEPFTSGLEASAAYASALETDAREELRERYFQRLGAPAGPFRLSARAWFVRGTVVSGAR